MSYRHSLARREFDGELTVVMKELKPLHAAAQTTGSSSRLLAAYYMFAYSKFEVYIKTFVEDALDVLNASPPPFEKWPDAMLAYVLHKGENLAGTYRRYGDDEDEVAMLRKVAQTARKIAAWSTGANPRAIIQATDVLDRRSYPSPKNLPHLFGRLGVETIWATIGREGHINGKLILTSLNDLRTGIAHEGRVPPGFSFDDLRSRIRQMRLFVAALDRGVTTHFCSGVISRADWNNAIKIGRQSV